MQPSLGASLEGRYNIIRVIGAGGMATVYLADDVRHKRKVALKVLKPELAAVLGADRFVQEITTTAALQHPHILPLFDSGTADGFLYYVMPFIDGETLRERLDRETQLGIDEAVKITVAVADALDYAHRHGVIHRDIKPENILLHEDRPMVADFGIALAVSAAAGGRMTETGLSLGTPHYMSPEQATAAKEISSRSDVYSLASVLYEMLAGNPPHTGASSQQIIMKIVTEEAAPVTKLRKAVPPNVAGAVAQALEKLPADRFASAKAFADALENPAFRQEASGAGPTVLTRARWDSWRGVALGTLALIAIAAVFWNGSRHSTSRDQEVSRFALALPPGQELQTPGGTRIAFAPDGRSFVYVGPGASGPRLWLRRLNELEAIPIAGTEGATSPTFSPDGSEIAFNTLSPFQVRIVSLANGQLRTVTTRASGGGLAWAANGYMYVDAGDGLAEVHPDGSGYKMLMPLDAAKGESGVAWPSLLPDARGILFRIRRGGELTSDYTIGVLDLHTGRRKDLLKGLVAFYAPAGNLVWVSADGILHAQKFDLGKLEVTGSPSTLSGGLAVGGFGSVDVALSSLGDLLYVTGEARNSIGTLVWVARDGTTSRVDSTEERGIIIRLAMSPDGKSVAMQILRGIAESALMRIWVKRLDGGPTHLVTSELANSRIPVWSPDGKSIFYISRDGYVMRRRADGSGKEETLTRTTDGIASMALSPDGSTLLLRTARLTVGRGGDILQFRIGVDSAPVPLFSTDANQDEPTISPDGKWLAYSSDESGQWEVYVRPFPNVDEQKIQISADGGEAPSWNPAGRELFYLSRPSHDLMSARFQNVPAFDLLRVDRLFNTGVLAYSAREHMFQPSADGSRFLAMDIGYREPGTSGGRIVLVQNFDADLEQKVRR
jgi:eukaryotic-like serine/threonine-protein kinase